MDGEIYENEIINYFKVWLQVIPCLCYCFFIGKLLPPKPFLRLFPIFPVFYLFLRLPLSLHSVHLCGTFAFFISWLANFKLFLFAFGHGPLSHPSLSLKQFLALASFPIKIQTLHTNGHSRSYSNINGRNTQNPHEKSQNGTTPSRNSLTNGQNTENPHEKSQIGPILSRDSFTNGQNPDEISQNGATPSRDSFTNGHSKSLNSNTQQKSHKEPQKSALNYAIKIVILAVVLKSYNYSQNFHPKLLLTLYCLHIYLLLEMILVMVAFMARTLIGIELEPQFDEPYLSSSLQDFWGRRWNIMVSKILRPTVYEPAYSVALCIMGRKWASLPAVFATFLVSGLLHELMFYYLGRVRPTWEITWFFLLHGFCLVVEIGLKKRLTGKFRLPRVISGPLTVGFVMVTAFWLFFPQLLRCRGDKRALEEYAAAVAFAKNVSHTLTFKA